MTSQTSKYDQHSALDAVSMRVVQNNEIFVLVRTVCMTLVFHAVPLKMLLKWKKFLKIKLAQNLLLEVVIHEGGTSS